MAEPPRARAARRRPSGRASWSPTTTASTRPASRSWSGSRAQLSSDVWVVAPETNQSGASHSLTMHRPLRIRSVSRRRFAVDGTPTDCVLLALQIVIKDGPVDLVLSGVNHGGNLGEDVTYSGTIAAAMEATLFNVPAFALSQCCRNGHPVKWATAEQHAPDDHRPPVHKGLAEGSADQRQLSRLPGRRRSAATR